MLLNRIRRIFLDIFLILNKIGTIKINSLRNINLNIYYYTLIGSSIVGLFVVLTNNSITDYQSFLQFMLFMVFNFRLFNFHRNIKCT